MEKRYGYAMSKELLQEAMAKIDKTEMTVRKRIKEVLKEREE